MCRGHSRCLAVAVSVHHTPIESRFPRVGYSCPHTRLHKHAAPDLLAHEESYGHDTQRVRSASIQSPLAPPPPPAPRPARPSPPYARSTHQHPRGRHDLRRLTRQTIRPVHPSSAPVTSLSDRRRSVAAAPIPRGSLRVSRPINIRPRRRPRPPRTPLLRRARRARTLTCRPPSTSAPLLLLVLPLPCCRGSVGCSRCCCLLAPKP